MFGDGGCLESKTCLGTTGLPAERIRVALNAPASHDRQAFRDRISLLIQLRNRL